MDLLTINLNLAPSDISTLEPSRDNPLTDTVVNQLSKPVFKHLSANQMIPTPALASSEELKNVVNDTLKTLETASLEERLKSLQNLYLKVFFTPEKQRANKQEIAKRLTALKPLLPKLLKALCKQVEEYPENEQIADEVMSFFSMYSYEAFVETSSIPRKTEFYPDTSLLIEQVKKTSSFYFTVSISTLTNLCYSDPSISQKIDKSLFSELIQDYSTASTDKRELILKLFTNLSFESPKNAQILANSDLFNEFFIPPVNVSPFATFHHFRCDSIMGSQARLLMNVLDGISKNQRIKFINSEWIKRLADLIRKYHHNSFDNNVTHLKRLLYGLGYLSPDLRKKVLDTELVNPKDIKRLPSGYTVAELRYYQP